MSDPYIGEIRNFGFGLTPYQWLPCDGRLLPIQQYAALYSLLGTAFGGNGTTTFALPDLRGRVPYGASSGSTVRQGEMSGGETVSLSIGNLPSHSHNFMGSTPPGTQTGSPNNTVPATVAAKSGVQPALYSNTAPNQPVNPSTVGLAGSSTPHGNMQPFIATNYCISLSGIYPQRP